LGRFVFFNKQHALSCSQIITFARDIQGVPAVFGRAEMIPSTKPDAGNADVGME
jgi:hypothetical protein